MDKPEFKTGNVGLEFVDEKKAANIDTTVLPQMVNAKIAADRRGNVHGEEAGEKSE